MTSIPDRRPRPPNSVRLESASAGAWSSTENFLWLYCTHGRTGPPGGPGGPVGLPSRWAAASNVRVGQTTYPVNRGNVGSEKGARDKVTKRRRGYEGVEEGRGPREP